MVSTQKQQPASHPSKEENRGGAGFTLPSQATSSDFYWIYIKAVLAGLLIHNILKFSFQKVLFDLSNQLVFSFIVVITIVLAMFSFRLGKKIVFTILIVCLVAGGLYFIAIATKNYLFLFVIVSPFVMAWSVIVAIPLVLPMIIKTVAFSALAGAVPVYLFGTKILQSTASCQKGYILVGAVSAALLIIVRLLLQPEQLGYSIGLNGIFFLYFVLSLCSYILGGAAAGLAFWYYKEFSVDSPVSQGG